MLLKLHIEHATIVIRFKLKKFKGLDKLNLSEKFSRKELYRNFANRYLWYTAHWKTHNPFVNHGKKIYFIKKYKKKFNEIISMYRNATAMCDKTVENITSWFNLKLTPDIILDIKDVVCNSRETRINTNIDFYNIFIETVDFLIDLLPKEQYTNLHLPNWSYDCLIPFNAQTPTFIYKYMKYFLFINTYIAYREFRKKKVVGCKKYYKETLDSIESPEAQLIQHHFLEQEHVNIFSMYNIKELECREKMIEAILFANKYTEILKILSRKILISQKRFSKFSIKKLFTCLIERICSEKFKESYLKDAAITEQNSLLISTENLLPIFKNLYSFATELNNRTRVSLESKEILIKAYPLKEFDKWAVNIQAIYQYFSNFLLTLVSSVIRVYDENDVAFSVSLIKFEKDKKSYIFDVYRIVKNSDELEGENRITQNMTWNDRLNALKLLKMGDQGEIIKIIPVKLEQIQCSMITPTELSKYIYLKTSGFGPGTFFYTCIGKKPTSKQRSKKTRMEDLECCNGESDNESVCSEKNRVSYRD